MTKKAILLDDLIGTPDEIDRLTPSPEDVIRGKELEETAREVLEKLTPTEEQILRMRFGISEPTDIIMEEVGQKFAVAVHCQIEEKALRRLKRPKASS